MSNSEEMIEEEEEQDEEVPLAVKRRVVTPTIFQMENIECGAVALAIVMAYYKKYVPLEELRIACSVSRDGSSAWNIIEAAKGYGFESSGYSFEIEDLKAIVYPAIVFWNFDHFVVLEGYKKGYFYINDPAMGPRTLTESEFDASFTGVTIVLEPTSTFEKSGSPPSLISSLYHRLKNVKASLLYIFIIGLCLVIPTLALPAFSQIFVDQIFSQRNMSWGFYLFSAMAFSILISSLLQWYQQKVLVRLYIKLSTRFACETFWHMLRLPVSFYNQRYPGEIAYRMVLNDFVSRNATNSLVPALLNILMVLFYGIAMFYYDPVIATIAIVASILNILMLRRVTRSRKDAYGKFQVDMGRSTSYSLGIINNIETIKATGLEFKFFPNWAGYYTKVVNNLQEIGNKNVFLSAAGPLISSLTTAAFIGIGGWRIINGQLTVGMFIALQILMRLFMSPISQLLQLSQSFQFLKVDLARLDDIMNHPTDPLLEQNKAPIEEFTHKIEGFAELKNVDFGYSPLEEPLLKNINFTLHPGKRIALVGATGCGKSTIAKLLAGIFYPRHGEVLFDGKPRAEIPRHILTSSLAFVEQEPFLFSGTIRENITLMDSTIKQEDVINAAKDACIHEDIMARKGGYDLMLEENGLNLSGGQRQRLEIARGLVKNPTILILDESTSALDSETEIQIIKNINRRGCAVLMIAHRLSSIRNCDEIYVLDKGHVVDVGTHNQLKKSSMIYKTLVESEHLNVEE